MADTNPQANTATDKAIQAVVKRYPDIYIPGLRLILAEIPGEVFHELGDDKRMAGGRS